MVRRIVFSILLNLITFSSISANEVLPIVGDYRAMPKNWLDENKQPVGIMIDLLDEVSVRTGIKFTFNLFPWKRAFSESEKGEGAIIGFSKNAQREKSWDYSEPMYFDELVLVTTSEKYFDFDGLESLKGRRLAIKSGTSYGDDFELARSKGHFVPIETPDRKGQMRMLAADRVDAVLVSPGRIALESVLAQHAWLREHKDKFIILEPAYKLDPNFLGIPKSMNKSHLIPLINSALEEIKSDGTYEKIVEKNIELAVKALQELSG